LALSAPPANAIVPAVAAGAVQLKDQEFWLVPATVCVIIAADGVCEPVPAEKVPPVAVTLNPQRAAGPPEMDTVRGYAVPGTYVAGMPVMVAAPPVPPEWHPAQFEVFNWEPFDRD
jgi:hypothetical protein